MFVRNPFLCYIPHRPPAYLAKTAMVKRFQFEPVCFFQCPAFASPEHYIDGSRLIEPETDIDLDLFVASFLAWLTRLVICAVSLSSGTK
jgi:hypothetical protein